MQFSSGLCTSNHFEISLTPSKTHVRLSVCVCVSPTFTPNCPHWWLDNLYHMLIQFFAMAKNVLSTVEQINFFHTWLTTVIWHTHSCMETHKHVHHAVEVAFLLMGRVDFLRSLCRKWGIINKRQLIWWNYMGSSIFIFAMSFVGPQITI